MSALLWAAVCGAVLAAEAPPLGHDQALQAAREGRYHEALAALRRLAAEGDARARYDLVVVYGWAGRKAEAIAAYERLQPPASAPDYVQRAAASAYRAQRRFPEAEALARAGVHALPADGGRTRLLAGVLVDSGRGLEAVALMEQTLRRPGADTDAENWLALGNAAAHLPDRPDPFTALRAYSTARLLRPADRGAAEAAAGVLAGLGAPYGAAMQLQDVPLDLRVAQAGRQVRWATQLEAPSPARRFEAIDAALAGIDKLLAEHRATPGADPALRTTLLFDRIAALRHRERWADTVAAAESLRAEGITLPGYVRQPEADALLALRRPEEALLAYDEVLAADRHNREARVGRFYAEVEIEDFAAAFATADALAAAEPEALRLPLDPTPRPNGEWLGSRVLAANARSYADMQAEAWQRMKPLADGAPALSYLRSAQASVAAARGWPRLADEEMHIAASLAPDNAGIRVGLADSAMRRQRWPEARERVAALVAEFPDDGAVQRSQRDLANHGLSELDTGIVLRRENGNAAAAPGNGIDAHLRLHSPPLSLAGDSERWRAVAAAERQTASPPEGTAVRIRYGLGARYRGPDVQAEALVWSNLGALRKGGFSVNGAWTPDDHLWLGAEAEAFAADTPLRALLYGTTADALGASASYTWNESRSVSVGFRGLDFSDGNQRRSVSLSGYQRLVTVPHFKLDARPGFYTSTNSKQGGAYFNPVRDRSVSLSLEADHVIWRFYERALSQQLALGAGGYWQDGYGAGAVGSLRYQQIWRPGPLTEWRYGAQIGRNLYDGVAERSGLLFINLNQRF